MDNIGIFGGTFNPPHKTHLEMVKNCMEQLSLSSFCVIPTGEPPHKFCALDKNLRFEMTKLAFSTLPNVEIDDFELKKEGKSYTVDTLRYLKQKYSGANLFFLIGSDSLREFDSWCQPEEILKLATLVCVERKGDEIVELLKSQQNRFNCKILTVKTQASDISSTEIRLSCQFGFAIDDYVPKNVEDFIKSKGLYAEFQYMTAKLPKYMSQYRLNHTFCTTLKALQLKSTVPTDKIFVACALHDIAKELPQMGQNELLHCVGNDANATSHRHCEEGGVADVAIHFGVNIDSLPQAVQHAFVGARVAMEDFSVTDAEILDAIAYHATAKPDMSELLKVLYIADKTERSRNYPTAHLMKPTLDQTLLAVLEEILHLQNANPKKCHEKSPLTQQAYDFYSKQQSV